MDLDLQQSPQSIRASKDTNQQLSFSDDNPGACCLCGLVTCSCVTGIGTFVACTQPVPIWTMTAWTCCFGTSLYLLYEIYSAHNEDRKQR